MAFSKPMLVAMLIVATAPEITGSGATARSAGLDQAADQRTQESPELTDKELDKIIAWGKAVDGIACRLLVQ